MIRTLAVALSCVVLSGILLAQQCTPLRDNNCVTATARGTCTVSAQWFADNSSCVAHPAILIGPGGHLNIGNGLPFLVNDFKQYNYFPRSTICDFSNRMGTPTNPTPFTDTAPAKLTDVIYVHNLTAGSGSNGCYEASLVVTNNDGTTTSIDPHIIVSGNNLMKKKHHSDKDHDAKPKSNPN